MSEEFLARVNVFEGYKQRENQFTNGLLALLELSTAQDMQFPQRFIETLLPQIQIKGPIKSFKVLKDYDKAKNKRRQDVETVDAEIIAQDVFLAFETKINSYCPELPKQIEHHLVSVRSRTERTKKLVLLTPDDRDSRFVKDLLAIEPEMLLPLQWKEVFKHFQGEREHLKAGVFGELIGQYLDFIKQRIFEQDCVGYIMKMRFDTRDTGTGLTEDRYIEHITAKDASWGLAKEHKELKTPRRRLLLFDPKKQAITVEMEIERTEKRPDTEKPPDTEKGYPFRNVIKAGSQMRFDPPILVRSIEECGGKLRNFKKRGARTAYWRLLARQYDQLTQDVKKVPLL